MASSRKTGTNENISTYGNVTRDYTTLATWEAATDINLVTAARSEILECYDDAASFNDHIALIGATTSSSYFRIIRPANGEGHDGTPNNGVTFSGTTDTPLLRIDELNSQIQDLIGSLNVTGTADRLVFGAFSDQAALIGCIAFNSANAGTGCVNGIAVSLDAETAYVIDCLVHNITGTGCRLSPAVNNAFPYIYNCTVTDCTIGFENVNASFPGVTKNCCVSGNGTDWVDAGGGITKTTCTVEGANPTYIDSGGDDFHLASGDTVCKDNGTDLSADGNYAFDDDIDEEIRSGTWDIGFDEYIAPNGFVPQIIMF